MTQFALAARSQVRNALLCTLATLTLAACGGGSGSGSAAADSTSASDPTTASLVSPNAGVIDRSQSVGDTANTSSSTVASQTSGSTPATASTTPASGATSGTGATIATDNKSTPPVVATTTSNGVATLDWMPPTENSDGSALTNLGGYTVYYGTSPDNLTQSIKVSNPGLTAYTVTGLSSGTWYFAVTSYSAGGLESSRSGVVSTQI